MARGRGGALSSGQDDVPALLRRVAVSVEELGDVRVHDLVLHTSLVDAEEWPSITVHYWDDSDGPTRCG